MDECIARRTAADARLVDAVYALVRYGSYERGDFVPGVSDIDYFAVFEGDDPVAPSGTC